MIVVFFFLIPLLLFWIGFQIHVTCLFVLMLFLSNFDSMFCFILNSFWNAWSFLGRFFFWHFLDYLTVSFSEIWVFFLEDNIFRSSPLRRIPGFFNDSEHVWCFFPGMTRQALYFAEIGIPGLRSQESMEIAG